MNKYVLDNLLMFVWYLGLIMCVLISAPHQDNIVGIVISLILGLWFTYKMDKHKQFAIKCWDTHLLHANISNNK